MKTDDLLDALGNIDYKYVEEAEKLTRESLEDSSLVEKERSQQERNQKKRRKWKSSYSIYLSAAACLCILLVIQQVHTKRVKNIHEDMDISRQQEMNEMAVMEEGLEESLTEDMAENVAENDEAISELPTAGGAEKQSNKEKEEQENAEDAKTTGELENLQQEVVQESCMEAADDLEIQDMLTDAEELIAEKDIVINKIDSVQRMIACTIEPAQIEALSLEEAEMYYDVMLAPELILTDLIMQKDTSWEIGYDEAGEVMCDNNIFSYADPSLERILKISMRTADTGEMVSFETGSAQKKSLLNEVEVTIGSYQGQDKTKCYLVLFDKGNVHVTIECENLSQEEMVAVLVSLLQ
ncbi:hypothetical protein LJC58_01180 [Lachnospiraceae bacterium OttesenSCG-928-D06]|nr:hypothetical protein [Lachnospiraceae bacterium OttesenSCG-928-D06]